MFLFACFAFLWPHPQHIEVPRLGAEQDCSCWPTPQPQQRGIQAMSATYATVHGNAGSLTHWVRPGMEPTYPWILVGFVNHWATKGTPHKEFLNTLSLDYLNVNILLHLLSLHYLSLNLSLLSLSHPHIYIYILYFRTV